MKLRYNLFLNLIILLSLTIFGEILTRVLIDYKSDFYALPKKSFGGKSNIHPYGEVPLNSNNYYDQEWDDPKTKKRYGYAGDSVMYGVGAGFPFRISEYLDIFEPSIEHVNLSNALELITKEQTQKRLIEFKENTKIDKVIFMLNLTDIVEFANEFDYGEIETDKKIIPKKNYIENLKNFITPFDQQLRGRSTLYTFIRYKIKNIFVAQFGLNVTGFRAIELEPVKYSKDIKQSAENFAKLINSKNSFFDICVIMLPYEMQISKKAKDKYRKIGVKFEDEFINFRTQKLFISTFKKFSKNNIYYLGKNFPESDIGEYFVYNLGDKIDFNHPNRYGHKLLAKEISERNLCLSN